MSEDVEWDDEMKTEDGRPTSRQEDAAMTLVAVFRMNLGIRPKKIFLQRFLNKCKVCGIVFRLCNAS